MSYITPNISHIPVVRLAFAINTPAKVDPSCPNSMISTLGDKSIEIMQKYYCSTFKEPYLSTRKISIRKKGKKSRLKCIIACLFRQRSAQHKANKIIFSPFEKGFKIMLYSEIVS